jgi:hypothetical protein
MRRRLVQVFARRSTASVALAALTAVLVAEPRAHAQDVPLDVGGLDNVRIQRISEPPVIDGVLDEEVWLRAPVIRDFHQVNPAEFSEPTEETHVYLLYDRDTLFIGARLFDAQPELITARILRQNQGIGSDDRFFVHIDSFNNRRSGYIFGVNPNGVRYDGIFENINQQSFDWDGIWQAAASVDSQGWVVEIAIPFKSLSFDRSNSTWRMNFSRNIVRKNESMAWRSRNRNTDLSTMSEVRGISQIDQGMGLDIVPTISAREQKNFVVPSTSSDLEPSVDVFYKITPSLNGSLTVNTDFSATEVDNRQVNLTRFSLFFPERRDFFLQDVDIFQFGRLEQDGRPFFSRTIGIGPGGQEVPIEAGGKISGRVGRFDIGTLAIRQEAFGGIDATTAFVGRVAANVLEESSLGMIVTDGDPASNLDNTVVGVDFRFLNTRFSGGRGMEGEVWLQQSDSEGVTGGDGAAGFGVRFPSSVGLRGGVGVSRIEQNFDPAMGFIRRRGIADQNFFVNWQWRPADGAIRTINTGIDYSRIEFLDDGSVQSESLNYNLLNIDLNSQDAFGVSVSRQREGLRTPFPISSTVTIEPGLYSFSEYGINVRTGNQRKLGAGLFFNDGEFYDGEQMSVGGFIGWRPSPHFRANVNYQYNDIEFPEGGFITRVVRLQLEAIFSSTLSWINLIQYDNVSNTVGLNSRLHWIPEAGREAFVVLNHNVLDLPDGGRRSTFNEAAVKFSYTFRF